MARHWGALHWRADHWRASHWSGLGVFPPNVSTDEPDTELLGTRTSAAVLQGSDVTDELLGAALAPAELLGFDTRATELLGDSRDADLEGTP